jgi:hypothetical protein
MATIPVQNTPGIPPAETIEERFRRLEAAWRADTYVLSSFTKIVGHPAFQEIIRLGDDVVPLMLRDLEERPRLWVWALPEITGENPVAEEDAGNIARMSEAWLKWGREWKPLASRERQRPEPFPPVADAPGSPDPS